MEPAEIALQAAVSYWQIPADQITVTDITQAKFPWSRQQSYFMAMNMSRVRLLVSVDAAGGAYAFQTVMNLGRADDARFNLMIMNSMFQAEGLRLPGDLDLPWTIRNMLFGLGGWVGSRFFFEAERDALAMWTTLRPTDGARLFEGFCADPKWQLNAPNWVVEFSYFNLFGGVEGWRAEGTDREVSSYKAVELAPNKTFLIPYG